MNVPSVLHGAAHEAQPAGVFWNIAPVTELRIRQLMPVKPVVLDAAPWNWKVTGVFGATTAFCVPSGCATPPTSVISWLFSSGPGEHANVASVTRTIVPYLPERLPDSSRKRIHTRRFSVRGVANRHSRPSPMPVSQPLMLDSCISAST